ncbi:hypothetical protein RG931_005453 [Pseudomonas syringae pv. actinidiae]|nr:hypothetical protein BV361_05694 [Pseudomonas syringae pv. actinidiae]BBM08761.1 hypothetical protein KPSA3_102480 [Pseudomonas syringae pv. actinidiae]
MPEALWFGDCAGSCLSATLSNPTAGCGKPHVRWCGRGIGLVPLPRPDQVLSGPCRSGLVREWVGTSDAFTVSGRLPSRASSLPQVLIAIPCGSGLVREWAGTSDVFSVCGILLSRASSLPRMLSGPCGSGLVREWVGTSDAFTVSGRLPSRASSLPVCPAWAETSHLKAVARLSDDNCSETQGGRREAKLKEARSKGATAGTRTGSEAGCGRLVFWEPRNPTVTERRIR